MPKANEHEAAVVDTLEVYGMNNIGEVISFLNDAYTQEPCKVDTRKEFYDESNIPAIWILPTFADRKM